MTPWQLAKETEHSHQRALFAWANCAALYGFNVASNYNGYDVEGREALVTGYKVMKAFYPQPALGLLFAIHNQGHGDKVRGGIAKAEGVKAGVPDMMLPVPRTLFAGLFIELKEPARKPKSDDAMGGLSRAQVEWFERLRQQFYRVEVAYGWIEAANIICDYMQFPNHGPKN